MKQLSILFFLFNAFIGNAQENVTARKFKFFDELGISVNRTNIADNNTIDKNGFGINGLFNLRPEKKFALLLGADFTRTHQHKKIQYEGHFAHAENVDLYISSLDIPVYLRGEWGNNTKLFVEAGGFFELNVGGRRKGIYQSYLPDENNQLVYRQFPFDERAPITAFNYGPAAGLGVKVKLPKNYILLKATYKAGLAVLSDYYRIYNGSTSIALAYGFE